MNGFVWECETENDTEREDLETVIRWANEKGLEGVSFGDIDFDADTMTIEYEDR